MGSHTDFISNLMNMLVLHNKTCDLDIAERAAYHVGYWEHTSCYISKKTIPLC